MQEVRIYVTRTCAYCTRAKRLLDGKGVSWEEIDVTTDAARRDEMVRLADGRTTVPQIFIGETHVGGYDDLAALEENGRLDELLAR